MEPNVSLGLSDLFKLGFDKTKVDFAAVDAGQKMMLDGLEKGVTSPANVDKWAFDALSNMLHNFIEGLKVPTPGPLVVGAFPFLHTKEEVEAAIISEGGDPKKFAPWLLILLQFAPMLYDIIRRLLGK